MSPGTGPVTWSEPTESLVVASFLTWNWLLSEWTRGHCCTGRWARLSRLTPCCYGCTQFSEERGPLPGVGEVGATGRDGVLKMARWAEGMEGFMDALRDGFTVRNFAGGVGGAAHRAAPNRVLPAVSGFVSVGAGRPTEAHDSLHCEQSGIAGIPASGGSAAG